MNKIDEKLLKIKNEFDKITKMVSDYEVFWLMYLTYCSVLEYDYEENKIPEKFTLDTLMISATGVGKSTTADNLINVFRIGKRIPLNGATVLSLIGGTDKRNNFTKLGLLPKEHSKLVFLEEFQSFPEEASKAYTDMRSSGKISIFRVAGNLTAPCNLRMMTIANPRQSFLNGDEEEVGPYIFKTLIEKAENQNRFDFCSILKGTKWENPHLKEWGEISPEIKKHFEQKIRWIWGLKSKDINFPRKIKSKCYIYAQKLNKKYNSDPMFLGKRLEKKLARLTCAIAAAVCSTKDYKTLDIKAEHIDYIYEKFEKNLNSDSFRLLQKIVFINKKEELTGLEKADFTGWAKEFDKFFYYIRMEQTIDWNCYDIYCEDPTTGKTIISYLIRANFLKKNGNYLIKNNKFIKNYDKFKKDGII